MEQETRQEIETEDEKLKAFLKEESPTYNRGDKIKVDDKDVVVRNIYSRQLEDLTFSDLNMLGYSNPNAFVKDRELSHGSFECNKIVWVVIYKEVENENRS